MLPYEIFPLLSYLLGSIPFGLILSNLFGTGNLRNSGSKNIGATNVLRTQGKLLGFLTFFLDFAKGFVACYLLQTDSLILNLTIIAAPVVGHMFPVWLKFKGGKGIATYFGVICSLNPYVFLGTLGVWGIVFAIFRISSVSGILSIISSCIIFFFVNNTKDLDFINHLYVLIALAVIIVAKHRDNIKRLINNSELKT